jgi:hypothetical protein
MDLEQLGSLTLYPRSVVEADGTTYLLARSDEGKRLGVLGNTTGFEGEHQGDVLLCPLIPTNAEALRDRLPWLRPVSLGLKKSFGFGDRLGLATPGHVRAVRHFSGLAPIFAQQSARENARTGRTPQQVMDDAMWGVFQEGWREPWGADADHLKTPEAMDAFIAAGYTLYTIDPGDHVDNKAHTAPPAEVAAKVQALPWSTLRDTVQDMEQRYLGRSFDLGNVALAFEREALWRAAAKYGHAIAHTVRMVRHLSEHNQQPFELEVSVDETETPTSPAEHFFIASELRRLGVRWVSLAPRFVGRFEKGVDYIGDLDAFEAEFIQHVAVAKAMGPYKLSLHSGSDKFSIYPLIAKHTGNGSTGLTGALVHVKTAGTSYLEALRAIADLDPTLFREILAFALERYREDKATYYVSANLDKVPLPDTLSDGELANVLNSFDGRQVLHVTFGSVLGQFGQPLKQVLAEHEEAHYAALESHFVKHLAPFAE